MKTPFSRVLQPQQQEVTSQQHITNCCLQVFFFDKSVFEMKIYKFLLIDLGENSQNFLSKFVRSFVTFRCFLNTIIHGKQVFDVINVTFKCYLLQKLLLAIMISRFLGLKLQIILTNLSKIRKIISFCYITIQSKHDSLCSFF